MANDIVLAYFATILLHLAVAERSNFTYIVGHKNGTGASVAFVGSGDDGVGVTALFQWQGVAIVAHCTMRLGVNAFILLILIAALLVALVVFLVSLVLEIVGVLIAGAVVIGCLCGG